MQVGKKYWATVIKKTAKGCGCLKGEILETAASKKGLCAVAPEGVETVVKRIAILEDVK